MSEKIIASALSIGSNIPTIQIIMKDGRVYKNTLTDWPPEYLRKPNPPS